jgi:hypothetical protein
MANPEYLAILKQGVEAWNQWRAKSDVSRESDINLRGADLMGANLAGADLSRVDFSLIASETDLGAPYDLVTDLSEADLTGADLSGVSLFKAKLGGAKLKGAILERTQLVRADLSKADLSEATLIHADLREAIIEGANLRGAYIGRADFRDANLKGADFSGAHAGVTNFVSVDLSAAKGLDKVVHYGGSTVGIDTLYKSQGTIPEVFLRGCGVPNEFIAYIGSMMGRPIEYYSCFISYSTHDQEFADRLYADLQAKGVRCWFAPHDIQGGRKIREQLDDAIRLHDKLLLVLSEHSMKSNWVKTEIADAREREEQEKKNLLFPITLAPMEEVKKWKLFDADRGIDSAREVREYYIPDFSGWGKDNRTYQTELGKLIRDLKAG